jgi:WD40 repeat protein
MGEVVKTLPFETTISLAVGLVNFSGPAQYMAATGTQKGHITLWDLSTGERRITLTVGERANRVNAIDRSVRGLAFGPDQRTLASLDAYGFIELWDLENMILTTTYDTNDSGFIGWGMFFDRQGEELMLFGHRIYSDPGSLILDLQSGRFTKLSSDFWSFLISGDGLFGINYIPNSDYKDNKFSVSSVVNDNPIEFNIKSSLTIGDLDASAISPDAHFLATGFDHSPIYIWDLKNHSLINSLEGHRIMPCDCGYNPKYLILRFNPQNDLLVSVGNDNTTRLWNIRGAIQLRQLNTCCLAEFSPDGRLLVTSGDEFYNAPIQVWGIPPLP